jgi:hypothetical protein
MITKCYEEGVSSCEGLKGFLETFSIYSFMRKVTKSGQTVHNPSQQERKSPQRMQTSVG